MVKSANDDQDNHFRGVTKMVPIGSGADSPIEDFRLTRYACYLIAKMANQHFGGYCMKFIFF